MKLTTFDHDRDKAGLRYVYPVVSRRARGVSIGINLNTDNACNWRCVYCQVPGLVRDSGRLVLGTASGGLEIVELQPPGKARMHADAFLRGYRGELALTSA